MAARKKWRRTITVQGRRFLWYVRDDPDGMGPVLHLFTPDKFLVAYYWLEGRRAYAGNSVFGVTQRGVPQDVSRAPDWTPRTVATPRFVAEVAAMDIETHRSINSGLDHQLSMAS